MPSRPVLVSLTSLPSRLPHIEPTLESLLAQTLPPDRILVALPLYSRREGCRYSIPGFLRKLERTRTVEVVRCLTDYGPGTKLLGALRRVPRDSCLIVVDDDVAYEPFLVEELHRAQER